MFPSMQLPQFIFDYIQCSYRSPIFDINAAFQLMEFIGITFIALAGGACLITLCFNDLLTIRNRLINWSKSLFLLFIKFFVITLNVITIILTFTQIPSFVPALFIENVCFWFLVIVSIFGKFYNNKKKKIDEEVVMSKITEKQEKEKSDIP